SSCCAAHSFEELAPVKNANAVEEHDQAGEGQRPDDLRFRRERADGEPDEQDGADAEREAGDADLADEIAQAYGEEGGENGLAADDVTCDVEHGETPLAELARGRGR